MAYHKILRRISCCFKAISLCILLVSKLRLNVFKSRMASRKEDKTILSQTRILLILKWCCCVVLLNFSYSTRSLSFSRPSRERNERILVTHESKYHVPYPCTKFANICCMNEKRMLPYQYMTTECGIAWGDSIQYFYFRSMFNEMSYSNNCKI